MAVAAAIGNLLQGWDNATIAGNKIMVLLLSIFFLNVIFFSLYSLLPHATITTWLLKEFDLFRFEKYVLIFIALIL